MSVVTQTECPKLKLIARGKVRDLYEVDDSSLLFVATDRISAFDVIMKNGIPGKGKILTQLSVFWFGLLADVLPNHLITTDISAMPSAVQEYRSQLEGRVMLVKKVKIAPIEAIVRGYVAGSGWAEYKKKGTICDISLPTGLVESSKLPEPLFTPSTKAEIGEHDENIHPSKVPQIVGEKTATEMAQSAVQLYVKARDYAMERGIIIADTKFEFGVDANGQLILADEVLTPDSSRFWPMDAYAPGRSQSSFDKQYLRDYLDSIGFDKTNGIELPQDVVHNTLEKYIQAFKLLTGNDPVL
ncbi:SAICAR synthetase [Gonapodya prolifera JEL478]|uniref:Phosphoribosylaminoimidazole-succinocarboxamide synthase n=1 Tax=Gonapodya prolifera (strain JEL478) TaxID=1344416 RepID=A0A139AVX4_GONPJ|nr:SAICAR synthetase [Gonapodya prolifera JEL478]|eukprot:KXS20880.1 SAICAR synthetase [Gonapodya prolifera JEL478]